MVDNDYKERYLWSAFDANKRKIQNDETDSLEQLNTDL